MLVRTQKRSCCWYLVEELFYGAPPDIINRLKKEVSDKVIVLYTPELFSAVGQFYENFEQVTDEKVREIMKRHGHRPL
jgi:predicted phosphoribosyltransferase